jgi:hypothetical protein
MKKRDIMKNLVSILIRGLLFFSACATNNIPDSKSLSSSYDGIWDGLAQTPGGDEYIKMEIKNGIVSGFFEYNDNVNGVETNYSGEKKINGYITSDNKLIIKSIIMRVEPWTPVGIHFETNVMSPDRIEGIYMPPLLLQKPKYDWYVVKPATGKSDSTISNVEGN